MGNNPVTRTLIPGTRIMLPHHSCFKITHINDFEFPGAETGSRGLIKALVLQTGIIAQDDLDNDIAYNNDNRHNIDLVVDSIRDVEIPELNYDEIQGKDTIMIGSFAKYNIDTKVEWSIEESVDFIRLETLTENTCKVLVARNIENVGSEFTLVGKEINGSNVYKKGITVSI